MVREPLVRDGAIHDSRGDVKTQFKKGQPRPKNAGRKKASVNKTTRDIREAVIAAGEQYGYDGNGLDGLTGAFRRVFHLKPEAWSAIAAKCMPSQHTIRQGRPKDCSTSFSNPMIQGPLVPIPKRSANP
jgi:hypothetical protein